jgi:hypothetical protein
MAFSNKNKNELSRIPWGETYSEDRGEFKNLISFTDPQYSIAFRSQLHSIQLHVVHSYTAFRSNSSTDPE